MLSSGDVRDIKFARAMGGYKQEEVDIFLDKVVADYAQFERLTKEFQARIEALNKENEELKASQNSIQNVLLSAQRLADRIVGEAKDKSEEIIKNAESNISVITAREKELSTTFELKAQERKSELEKELSEMIKTAKLKAESITAAAEDSVARQQLLFDKLKMEIAAFKSGVSAKYKEHLEILSTIPDTVPTDPKRIAEIIATSVDKAPEPNDFIKNAVKNAVLDEIGDKEELSSTSEEEAKKSSGFSVENFEQEDTE